LAGTHTLLRCEEALKLWKTGKFDLIVTSGTGNHYYDSKIQTVRSADIMKQWLVSSGVPEAKILSENESLDTYTNIYFSLKLLRERNIHFENLIIVSHWTHLARIKIILWRNYRIKLIGSPVKYKLSLIEWLHEIVMFFCNLIDKTGYGLSGKLIRKFIERRVSPQKKALPR
jgi:uncharacterized SAM-binding protein YcdF (DUF218 family)